MRLFIRSYSTAPDYSRPLLGPQNHPLRKDDFVNSPKHRDEERSSIIGLFHQYRTRYNWKCCPLKTNDSLAYWPVRGKPCDVVFVSTMSFPTTTLSERWHALTESQVHLHPTRCSPWALGHLRASNPEVVTRRPTLWKEDIKSIRYNMQRHLRFLIQNRSFLVQRTLMGFGTVPKIVLWENLIRYISDSDFSTFSVNDKTRFNIFTKEAGSVEGREVWNLTDGEIIWISDLHVALNNSKMVIIIARIITTESPDSIYICRHEHKTELDEYTDNPNNNNTRNWHPSGQPISCNLLENCGSGA